MFLLHAIKYTPIIIDYGRDDRRERDKRDDRDRRDYDGRDKRRGNEREHDRDRGHDRDKDDRRDRDRIREREHDNPPPRTSRTDNDRGRGHTEERGDSVPLPSAPGVVPNVRGHAEHDREEGEEGEEDAPIEDAVDDDEAAMRAMMGFGGFDTTKVRLLLRFPLLAH